MEALKKQRTSTKAKLTRVQTFLDNVDRSTTSESLEVRREGLEAAWSDYNRIHMEILENCTDIEAEAQEADYVEVESKYYDLKVRLKGISSQQSNQNQPTNLSGQAAADIRLPRLELPVFSGDYLEWCSFRDLFTSIIHKNEAISPSQKLHYLKTSLAGEAATLLHSIEITDANYTEAWKLLNERYQNERQLIQCHLKALMGQSSLIGESANSIRNLLDSTVKHVRALSALGIDTEKWDEILVFVVTEKLDSESRREWELASPGTKYPKFSDLKTYLEQRCRALQASTTKPKTTSKGYMSRFNNKQNVKSLTSAVHQPTGQVCLVCKKGHTIYKCPEFMTLNGKERTTVVRKHSLCFNCLRGGHSAKQCRSESNCHQCGGRHHTTLHLEAIGKTPGQDSASQAMSLTNHLAESGKIQPVLLSTAVIRIQNSSGGLSDCRALLDPGSQASFVSESCVQGLGVTRSKAKVSVTGIGNSGSTVSRGLVNLQIYANNSKFTISVTALILDKLTSYRSPVSKGQLQQWAEGLNICLADDMQRSGPIDIILGADVFGEVLAEGMLKGQGNRPPAYNTQFGWIFSGKVDESHSQPSIAVNLAIMDLQEQLKQFWELEELPLQKHWTLEEQRCEEHYKANLVREPSGRYKVKLPFRDEGVELGRSRAMAASRLAHIERKLNQLPQHKEKYSEFMQEYLALGHMERVPQEQQGEMCPATNYLPHHFVTKEDSSTTKLRVVFDASAKTSTGVALNEKLMVGPKLQDDIWEILLRFRTHKVALTADIAKMYRQINVTDSDSDLQRILWREHPEDEICEFRLKTLTYGTSSAPYLATKTLQQLAKDEAEEFPLASKITCRDFYVDDLISGAGDVSEAFKLQSELMTMMQRGGFQLRKWSSNQPELVNSVPEEYREVMSPVDLNRHGQIKALGLRWQPSGDYFFIVANFPQQMTKITNRSVCRK